LGKVARHAAIRNGNGEFRQLRGEPFLRASLSAKMTKRGLRSKISALQQLGKAQRHGQARLAEMPAAAQHEERPR